MENTYRRQLLITLKDTCIVRSSWSALLDEPLRSEAQAAVLCVAERLCNPHDVQGVVQQAKEQSLFPLSWDLSSPNSTAEVALFYDTLFRCFPEPSWQVRAQSYLKLMAASSQQRGLASPSLFGGISGVAFVVQQCSNGGRHYQQTLAHLHHALAEQVRQRSIWHLPRQAERAETDFDLISGASGILAYLASIPSPDLAVGEALHTLLAYLLDLTDPNQPPGQERWFCPPSRFISDRDRQSYPSGRFNCGLAHGIAGPLSALSLTALAGYDHPGLYESIQYASAWLLQHSLQDAWGITWPTAIPAERALSPKQWRTLQASRTAWCYGAPGIARSLWLAGMALQDRHLMEEALAALKAVLRRPASVRQIDAPTLCHGTAGLLLICLHFAHESQDPWLLEQIPHLVEQILVQFDPQSPLGFRDIEPGGVLVDQPALLTGAPGTVLALLAAASAVAPAWDRLLLLS